MSRLGKKPIIMPAGVTGSLQDGKLTITGPKGTLTVTVHPRVKVNIEGASLAITVVNPENLQDKALWGLFASLIKNMVTGVTQGFEKKLEMNGIGFKAEVRGQNLVLDVGFSHSVNFPIPTGIEIVMEKNIIKIRGIDKQLVGSVAAKIRSIKPPEPYLGKGIKYADEIIRRKAGKAATAAKAS